MKMLLSSCLALCASVVSAESFVGAEVHAQLRGAVDGARVIAQASMPPAGTAIHPLPPVTEAQMLGEWEIMSFRFTDSDGRSTGMDYTDDAVAKGGATEPSGLTLPLLLAYTERARHVFTMSGGKRAWTQVPVKHALGAGAENYLLPSVAATGLWEVAGPRLSYLTSGGHHLVSHEVLRTGPEELSLTGSMNNRTYKIRMRRVNP